MEGLQRRGAPLEAGEVADDRIRGGSHGEIEGGRVGITEMGAKFVIGGDDGEGRGAR